MALITCDVDGASKDLKYYLILITLKAHCLAATLLDHASLVGEMGNLIIDKISEMNFFTNK